MTDHVRELVERIAQARKRLAALEAYMAQLQELVQHLRQTIAEAEALAAAVGAPE